MKGRISPINGTSPNHAPVPPCESSVGCEYRSHCRESPDIICLAFQRFVDSHAWRDAQRVPKNKVSRSGYAVDAIASLMRQDGKWHSVDDITESANIPKGTASEALRRMEKAGVLSSRLFARRDGRRIKRYRMRKNLSPAAGPNNRLLSDGPALGPLDRQGVAI